MAELERLPPASKTAPLDRLTKLAHFLQSHGRLQTDPEPVPAAFKAGGADCEIVGAPQSDKPINATYKAKATVADGDGFKASANTSWTDRGKVRGGGVKVGSASIAYQSGGIEVTRSAESGAEITAGVPVRHGDYSVSAKNERFAARGEYDPLKHAATAQGSVKQGPYTLSVQQEQSFGRQSGPTHGHRTESTTLTVTRSDPRSEISGQGGESGGARFGNLTYAKRWEDFQIGVSAGYRGHSAGGIMPESGQSGSGGILPAGEGPSAGVYLQVDKSPIEVAGKVFDKLFR